MQTFQASSGDRPVPTVNPSARGPSIPDRIVRAAEELLGEELEARLHRLNISTNEAGIDPFGFDPQVARYALTAAAFFHRAYFRTVVRGIENVPKGRVLIVANHSGQVPIDGMLIATSLILDAEPPRFPRSMVEKWSATLPFFSVFFPRTGQVIGSPENARRLLNQEEAIVVFPEGVKGISKPFSRRYRLEEFGNGFMRLALETRTPIVPVSVIGAEEQYPSIMNLGRLGKLIGAPALPVLPQLLFGWALPLPTRIRITFGKPMWFEGDPDDEDAVVDQKVSVVRNTIQGMLHDGLAARRSIFR